MKKTDKFIGNRVIVGDMPFNVAMRKFKQQVDNSGVLEALKENSFFEKPTTERKRKKKAAQARHRRQLRAQELPKKLF